MTTRNGVMPIWMFLQDDDAYIKKLWNIVRNNPLNTTEYGDSFEEFKKNWIKQKKIKMG